MKLHILVLASCGLALALQAQPYAPEQLQLRNVIDLAADAGAAANSTFNPRYFDGFAYVVQVNAGSTAFGRYPSGSPEPSIAVNNADLEHRMIAPFRGPFRFKYLLGSGSGAASVAKMSRYDFDGSNRVSMDFSTGQIVEGFDWVDEDTIICTSYGSGQRKRLFLADVVVEPFSITLNKAWNVNGYVDTAVSTRIRNVRVGDVHKGYAYYGDAGQNTDPKFYAVDLTTGAQTELGNAGTLTGGGSYGIWSVLERGGYLYVQTTDNGIQVYRMNNATTLGPLSATYDKGTIDAITGYSGQYYGLDVSPDQRALILGASGGKVYELGSPSLFITTSGTELQLAWPVHLSTAVIQFSPGISPAAFTDMEPQPSITSGVKLNTANVPAGATSGYFRLRQ